MTLRPRGQHPQRTTVAIRGRAGHWRTYPLGTAGPGTLVSTVPNPRGTAAERIAGRKPDGLPNAQAFSLATIQAYPRRTAICRECPEIQLQTCARSCCGSMQRTHAALLNALAGGTCPRGLFSEEL